MNNYYVFQDSNYYFIIKNYFHLVLSTTRQIPSTELDTCTQSEIDNIMSHTMNIIFKYGDLVENQSGVCIKNITNNLQIFSDALDIHRYRYIKLTDLDDTGLQLWKELNLN